MEDKNSRKNPLKSKRLLIIILVLAIIIVTGVIGVSYAAYTRSTKAQRTIAAYDEGGEPFSSNYLLKGSAASNLRMIYVTNGAINPSAVFTACNYPQGRQSKYNVSNIEYDVSLSMVYYDGAAYSAVTSSYLSENRYNTADYQMTVSDGTSTVTLGGTGSTFSDTTTFADVTITGGSAVAHLYTITFGTGIASNDANLYLEVTVTPDGGLPTLRGIFAAGIRGNAATNSWTGAFSDDTSAAPSDYDGFNYVVMGTGSGTFTLRWDSTKVTLSYQSQLLLGQTASQVGDTDIYEVSFEVDSDDVSRYDLQFYKVEITTETWPYMNGTVVSYTYA